MDDKSCHCQGSENGVNRTALFEIHLKLGARMVNFAGWEMPIQYSSIPDEHIAVRKTAGIFDISHMGQILIRGKDTVDFLNFLLTNNVRKLKVGEAQYSLMCNSHGGVIDDLYVYRISPTAYKLVVNASRRNVDLAYIQQQSNLFSSVEIIPQFSYSAVAIQGPNSARIIDKIIQDEIVDGIRVSKLNDLLKKQFAVLKSSEGEYIVSRTGYTGEDGFEVFGPANVIIKTWVKALEEGKEYEIKPAGLGARDSLRLEACYPLYSHELSEKITPIEAGLKFFIDFEKGEFIGKKSLLEQLTSGVQKRCISFKMSENSPPPRYGYKIIIPESVDHGWVTSGGFSPILKIGIGMGFVPTEFAEIGRQIQIEIRNKLYQAEIVKKPFYKRC